MGVQKIGPMKKSMLQVCKMASVQVCKMASVHSETASGLSRYNGPMRGHVNKNSLGRNVAILVGGERSCSVGWGGPELLEHPGVPVPRYLPDFFPYGCPVLCGVLSKPR